MCLDLTNSNNRARMEETHIIIKIRTRARDGEIIRTIRIIRTMDGGVIITTCQLPK